VIPVGTSSAIAELQFQSGRALQHANQSVPRTEESGQSPTYEADDQEPVETSLQRGEELQRERTSSVNRAVEPVRSTAEERGPSNDRAQDQCRVFVNHSRGDSQSLSTRRHAPGHQRSSSRWGPPIQESPSSGDAESQSQVARAPPHAGQSVSRTEESCRSQTGEREWVIQTAVTAQEHVQPNTPLLRVVLGLSHPNNALHAGVPNGQWQPRGRGPTQAHHPQRPAPWIPPPWGQACQVPMATGVESAPSPGTGTRPIAYNPPRTNPSPQAVLASRPSMLLPSTTPQRNLFLSRRQGQYRVAPGGTANVSSMGPHGSLNQDPHWPRLSVGPRAVLAGSASLLLPSTTPQRNLSLSRRQVLWPVPGDTANGSSVIGPPSRDQTPPCPRASDG
jgi:hypothetical protein